MRFTHLLSLLNITKANRKTVLIQVLGDDCSILKTSTQLSNISIFEIPLLNTSLTLTKSSVFEPIPGAINYKMP